MSGADWTFRYLVARGSLTADRLGSVLSAATELDLWPNRGEQGGIATMSGDGMVSAEVASTAEMIRWLAVHDGLFNLSDPADDIEISVSLHRVDGILPAEMQSLPDEPLFDVCAVSVDGWVFDRPDRAGRWARVNGLLRSLTRVLDPVFVDGQTDDMVEATLDLQCAHRRLAEQRLPAAPGWLIEANETSPLADALRRASTAVSRPLTDHGGYLRLQLTGTPWTAKPAEVAHAGALIRKALGDRGCPADRQDGPRVTSVRGVAAGGPEDVAAGGQVRHPGQDEQ